MTSGAVELLNVAGGGSRLRVTAVPHPVPGVDDDPWFDTAIAVDAYPFAGTVETIFTLNDFRDWARALRRGDELPRQVVLGGNRAAEVVIDIQRQVGGTKDAIALEISVTPSGDDPWPLIRFLVFDVAPFWNETATRIDDLG